MVTFRPAGARFPTTLTEAESTAMQAHLLYLARLQEEKRLRFAGRDGDNAFGMAILELGTEEEARAVADGDPAVVAGVLSAEVRPYPMPVE